MSRSWAPACSTSKGRGVHVGLDDRADLRPSSQPCNMEPYPESHAQGQDSSNRRNPPSTSNESWPNNLNLTGPGISLPRVILVISGGIFTADDDHRHLV